jgi:hypothetical protein
MILIITYGFLFKSLALMLRLRAKLSISRRLGVEIEGAALNIESFALNFKQKNVENEGTALNIESKALNLKVT